MGKTIHKQGHHFDDDDDDIIDNQITHIEKEKMLAAMRRARIEQSKRDRDLLEDGK
jgi:hypothetical protein